MSRFVLSSSSLVSLVSRSPSPAPARGSRSSRRGSAPRLAGAGAALCLLAAPAAALAQPGAPSPAPAAAPSPVPAPAPPGTAPEPDRSGATFELGFGIGFTRIVVDGLDGLDASDAFTGISGLNLGIGSWISPRTALTARITSTSFFEDVGTQQVQFIAGMLGLTLQHMVADRAWVGAGLGIGVLTTDQDDIESETGFALDLRAGVNLHQSRRNAFHFALEVTPGFYDGISVVGVGFQLGWQAL